MITATMTWREADLSGKLQDIRELVRRGLVDPEVGTLSKQGQLLVAHCIKLTPPGSVGQGKDRVRFDFNRIFDPIDPAKMRDKHLAKLIRTGSIEDWNAAVIKPGLRDGGFGNKTAVEPTHALHQANRDRRGRAKRTNFVTLYKQRSAFRALLKASVAHVGWAKAGWLKAYQALRGDRTASWFARHGQARGVFIDGRSGERPFIAAYNNTGWGRNRAQSDRVMQAALAARTRAMASFFNTTMRLASEGTPTRWQAQMRALAAQEAA